jgi:hypothetical protein
MATSLTKKAKQWQGMEGGTARRDEKSTLHCVVQHKQTQAIILPFGNSSHRNTARSVRAAPCHCHRPTIARAYRRPTHLDKPTRARVSIRHIATLCAGELVLCGVLASGRVVELPFQIGE